MTIDFTLFDPLFESIATQLIGECLNQGLEMRPTSGLRTLEEQNRIWRRSRPTNIVEDNIQRLRMEDCDYLADCLESVGPQPNAKWGTNAIGGLSWHNWGQAMDCLLIVDGRVIENGEAAGYKKYGRIAKDLGLRWGGDFKEKKSDPGHVQLNQKEISQLYSLKEINDHFRDAAKKV